MIAVTRTRRAARGSTSAQAAARPPRQPGSIRNVLSNWGAFVFTAAVGLVLSPMVVQGLGDTLYGVWVLIGSMVGYLGLLDLGVRGAVMRYLAKLHAASDHREAGRIAAAALALFAASGTAAILLSVVVALGVEHIFTIPEDMVRVARIVLVVGGINVAIALVTGVFGGVVTAMQRFDLLSGVDVAVEAGRALAIALALHLGEGLVVLAVIQLAASAVRGMASVIISHHLYPELRFALRSWQRTHLRQILGYSLSTTVLNVAMMVVLQVDALVIGAFLPVAMIAFFGIASTLSNMARSLVNGFSQTITPRVSAMQGAGNESGVGPAATAGGRLATLVLLPVVITLIIRGESFIGVWMGPHYAPSSAMILGILSVGVWVAAGRQVLSTALMGLDRHHRLVPGYISEAVLNLVLSIWWVQSYGLAGVAWGTSLPHVVVSIIFVPWVFCSVTKSNLRNLWVQIWIRPSVAMIPFMIVSWLLDSSWKATGVIQFFFQVLVTLPAALLGAWAIGLSPSERLLIRSRLRMPTWASAGVSPEHT